MLQFSLAANFKLKLKCDAEKWLLCGTILPLLGLFPLMPDEMESTVCFGFVD